VGQRLAQISISMVCLLLAACSSGREGTPQMCMERNPACPLAPKKATSRPYEIKGVWYHPQPHYDYDEIGIASYYGGGDVFHGRPTATGEIFDMNEVTAAHKTLPLPCIVQVTNLDNGRQIQLKVNDRGPLIEGRIIDLSRRGAQLLGFENKGTAKVRVSTLVPESLALNRLDPSLAISSPVMLAEAIPTTPLIIAQGPSLPDTFFEEQEAIPTLASVSSPVLKPEVRASTGIFVHVGGGYTSQKEAHALSQTLNGFTDSPVKPVKSDGPRPYAVRLGPLPSMSHANQVLDQLADAGHVMSRIVIQR